MDSFLLNRQLGSISPQTLARAQHSRLQGSLQLAADVRFVLQRDSADGRRSVGRHAAIAHHAGVNGIAIDRFEGR